MTEKQETSPSEDRRAMLKKLGRFALVSAPTVTLLLAAGTKPAKAASCSNCGSSRAFKNPEGGIDGAAMLATVASLPMAAGSDIGSGAGDFRAAFGVGDGASISPIDGVGVCLAAIRALTQRVGCLEERFIGAARRQAA